MPLYGLFQVQTLQPFISHHPNPPCDFTSPAPQSSNILLTLIHIPHSFSCGLSLIITCHFPQRVLPLSCLPLYKNIPQVLHVYHLVFPGSSGARINLYIQCSTEFIKLVSYNLVLNYLNRVVAYVFIFKNFLLAKSKGNWRSVLHLTVVPQQLAQCGHLIKPHHCQIGESPEHMSGIQ